MPCRRSQLFGQALGFNVGLALFKRNWMRHHLRNRRHRNAFVGKQAVRDWYGDFANNVQIVLQQQVIILVDGASLQGQGAYQRPSGSQPDPVNVDIQYRRCTCFASLRMRMQAWLPRALCLAYALGVFKTCIVRSLLCSLPESFPQEYTRSLPRRHGQLRAILQNHRKVPWKQSRTRVTGLSE